MTRKCPVCPETDLIAVQRSGVTIDYCPACRGVWLDRGEMEKIIKREQDPNPPTGIIKAVQPRPEDYRRNDEDKAPPQEEPPAKRRSLFADLFDLFD